VILGRDGERPGTLAGCMRATLDGAALLHDGLRLRDGDAHVALAPGHRVLTTIGLLGARPETGPGVLALEGPGALARFSGPSLAGVEAALAGLWEAWSLGVGSGRGGSTNEAAAAERAVAERPPDLRVRSSGS